MAFHFFALISRMKYILRWGLMRNTQPENIAEHCHQVAVLAHGLALIHNRRFGGAVSPGDVAVLALYHDASEILTGDLPTPVKYFNPEIKSAYRQVEHFAKQRLCHLLPEELRGDYEQILQEQPGQEMEWKLVKAADRLSAYIKCVEEIRSGNLEFRKAAEATLASVEAMGMPETEVFLQWFMPGFSLTLDEIEFE